MQHLNCRHALLPDGTAKKGWIIKYSSLPTLCVAIVCFTNQPLKIHYFTGVFFLNCDVALPFLQLFLKNESDLLHLSPFL